MSPPCEAILAETQLNQAEVFYPLHVFVCEHCFLVQLEEYVSPEHIFTDYAYFSSYSDSWLAHAKAYTERWPSASSWAKTAWLWNSPAMTATCSSISCKGIPVLGIEPAANVAEDATRKGIPTLVSFFGQETAQEMVRDGSQADLIVGNNVLAQVPDINDFVTGMKILLEPEGVITLEFPHLMRLMEDNQFDTIYHEHLSYFSFLDRAQHLFAASRPARSSTSRSSPRMAARCASMRAPARRPRKPDPIACGNSLAREDKAGFTRLDAYARFDEQVKTTKRTCSTF